MPISKIKVNSEDRAEGEPLVDLELDLTSEEMRIAYGIGYALIEKARGFITNSPLAKLINIHFNVHDDAPVVENIEDLEPEDSDRS